MPNYYLNGDRYDIPDEVVADFEKDNPDAVISYRNGNDIYDIPVSEKEGFLKAYPQATLYDGETKSSTTREEVLDYPKDSSQLLSQSSMTTGAVLNDNSAGPQRQLRQPTLRELAGGKSAIAPIESVANNWTGDRNDTRFLRGQQAARLQEAWKRGELDALDTEEERRIDAAYTPKPVTSYGDIVENYSNRFALTRRGGELRNEYAAIEQETVDKYLREFVNTPAYREAMKRQYPSEEERSKAVNEAFQSQYGERISEDMRPYAEALDAQLMNRYRGRIQEEFAQMQKQRSTDQLKTLAGEVDALAKQTHERLQNHAGSSGNAMNALMGSRSYMQASSADRREAGMLEAARRLIEQSQETVAEAGKKGNTNFVAGLGRGLRDNMDWENFTFGLVDAADQKLLNDALEKYERGETLDDAEQKLLEASAVNLAVQGFYSSDLGRGYKAGKVSAESLPFMLEFVANPISASSNAIAKSLLKFGLRRFGRAGSFAARVAGSTGAALGMTATSGLPRVAAGTMERLNQNYDYYLDENGDLQVQKTGNTGVGEALGKSIASTALEKQSEMVLNAFRVFRPYLRGVESALPGGVNSFMQMVGKSRAGQLYKELKNNPTLRELVQRIQFQGLPQEYLEEVYDNFANIPLGDMTLEEATDLDNNLDIVLGLTPTFLSFGMIGAGSMAAERYHNRRRMERIFGRMTDEQRKKFDELQRMSREHGNEDIKAFIRFTMSDPGLTQQQKREEIEYAFAIATQNAIDEVQEAETQDQIDAETQDILSNSDPGTNTYTECARIVVNDVGEMVEVPGHIVGYMSGQPLWKPDGAGPEVEAVVLKEGEYNPESIQSMPTQEVIDETAQAIREDAAAQAQRESTYSPDIIPPAIGTTFTDGTAQYQIAQQNPNGGWLATRTTVDENGKQKEEVVEITDEQYYNAMQAQIDAQDTLSQQSSSMATVNTEAVRNATVGDLIRISSSYNENYFKEHPEDVADYIAGPAKKTADYINGNLSDRDYLIALGYSTGKNSWLDDATDEEISSTAAENKEKYMPYVYLPQATEQQNTQEIIIQQPNNTSANATIITAGTERNLPEQSPQQMLEEGAGKNGRIPTDEKGNPLYHRAPVETTVASINSEGLEPDEVEAFVQANKDASAKLLKNLEGKAPKMGTNIAKYKADKAAWQEKVADAKKQVDYWNQVGDAIAAQRTQVGDTTAEDIRVMGEPLNGHELAAMMMATGRLPLLQSDYLRETGYRSGEARNLFGLFASEENGGMTIERAGEQLMLADQEDGTNFFDPNDPNAGRNAILDVLAEVRTRGDLTNYIRRNREAMAERERQAEYDAYADWCEREMHMTPEEYEAYQEYIAENNPYEGVAVEELDRIFAEAEEAYHNNITSQDNGQEGTSENGSETDSGPSQRHEPAGEAGSRETGVSILPGAQPVLQGQVQGRAGGTETESRPADDGVRAEEGTVSEGASGGERIENQANAGNNEINVVSSQSNSNETENEPGEVEGISGESSGLDGENEAASILRRAGDRTAASDGRGRWTKESLLRDVVRRSKESQTWIEDIQPIAGKHLLRGGENDVYLSNDSKSVIKVNDFSYLPDNSTNFDSFMNRVDAHNELFPHDAITIIGFTLNSEGRVSVVLSQPYISNAREATQEEIDNFLEGMDFYTDMSGNWTDGTFDIADTKPNNVLVDEDGNLHFIDVLPYDSRKPGKMLVIPKTRNDAYVAPERQEDENLLDYAERVTKAKDIADARKEVSSNPTDAQKEAGNYKKGHITLDGYDITIENPKGSTRSGVDASGQPWSVTMNNDYGYIRGTEGVDGDHIDVFLSDDPTTGKVYVIDQVNSDGTFDEHKVMYGFKSALAAKRAYLANYSPGWKGLGIISEVSKEEFKKWVESSHRKTKPFAEYKSVKVDGAQNDTIKTHQPNALPGRLMKAYESGDTALIASVEQEMREFVNSANDMRSVYSTYLRSKDLERAMEKGSPSNKTQHFIAETCKDVLKKAGLPTKAMQPERARTEIAGSMTDPHVLDIMSADTSFNVLRAIIHNPNTSESTLKHFTKVFSNNGLDYEAQQELDGRKKELEQQETEKIKEQSGPVTKIEDVGEKIGGAKKDRFKEFVEKEKQLQEKPDSFMEELRKLPVSKIFNFNLEALRKDGLSNEAATLIDVIRRIIPSKPRTDWKLKRWVSDVFGLYRFCLTLATAEQGTFDQVLERATHIKKIGGMYRAQMALGGFDSSLDTGQATLEELGDTAGHYDKEGNWVSIKGQWYVTNAGRYGGIYPDYETAKDALSKFAGENSKPKEKGTEIKFSIYSYKNSGESFITPKGKPNIVVESGFKSSKEALDYLNEHMDELQAKYRNMKDATSIGFAPNSERQGKDWRGGKDVTAEDFRNTFGFRGVEFGNWANQQERQRALNQAYDAFMDLSEATGISPRGLSLGGELGMAFGARGGGGAAAHYEPGKVVINLTKTQGAGTLAHEWWHAIDNYFSRRRGQALGYNTERKGYNLPVRGGKVEQEHEAERKEITNAFTTLMKAINGSSYGERSNAYASLKSSYWKEPTELGARAFAVWVERKLSEKGIVNNFLANNNTIGWESPELTQKYYPYPLESDFESLDVAFDNLFGAIEEKVDEETGNTVLYRNGAGFLSDDALSVANNPVSKLLGQSTRTAKQRRAFAERERRNMATRVQELVDRLHLNNVEIVNEPMAVTDRKGNTHYPKGFYNRATDKITIVIPNNVNTFDAEQTLLHEAVAHYGLRQLFGEHFDTFLDNVFNNADVEVRRKIVALAQRNGWNTQVATEEYLASLAENTNFDDLNASWWEKIKSLFLDMLHKIGFDGFTGVTLTDNELRYILWRSYENLRAPGSRRSILGQAEDIAKQYELKVGNYVPTASGIGQVAETVHSAKAERIRKLRDIKPVEITGEEYRGKYELNRDSAQKYVLDNLRGEYTIKDTGEKVNLSKVGAKKVTSHSMGNEAHLKSIAAIPQLISNAIFIEERPPYKEGAQYDSYRYYVTGLKLNGEDYTVRMTIGVKNGKYYYDHYLTNIEKGNLIEIAQGFTPTEDAPNPSYADDKGNDTNSIMQADEIEKGTLIDNLNGMAKSVAINQSSPISGIKDTKLLSILQPSAEEDLLFRETPDGIIPEDGTRQAYNRAVSGNRFKAQEAYQDSMLALKRLQEVIEQKTGKLKSYENAYLAENQMSSKSTRETEVYGEKFFKPMLEAVGKLMEKGASYGEIIDYMVAKHGLERNEVFAKRDAEQEADHRYEKLYKEIEQLYKLGGITEKEYNKQKNKLDTEKEEYYQNRLAKHLDEDYSGLTALAEKYDAIDEGFKAHAQKLITDFEDRFDTKDLWEKVNAATKETLRKSYESGMMSRDAYDKVSKQFKYYIPLRGWDEQTAEDVYEYLNSETSPVNSVLKTAKGRRSMADDPLATIGYMAESTILQGNRNLMKQNFLNMAINHPTDVLTLKEAWYVQDPSTGEWTLSFPDIREGDDAATISSKVEEHEQRMQELKEDGLATQVKEGLNINYRIGTRQAQEHIVTVKRNGRDYLVYVNGNPRAAQAVNGLTDPTVESNKLLAGISRFNRELAANFTNRNPAFVLSNLSRDLIFSVSAVAVKENKRYAARFAKNIPRAMRVIFRNLRGKGNETNADDRMFEEFLAGGGETGYTSLHSVDEYKKLVKRSVGKYSGKKDYFAAVRSAAGFFSMMNRWAEDVSRFTTYMTSREEGRTITDAVNDAKEVTVNFNRRGAATKTSGVFGWTSGLFRNLYLFFNAAVQSLTNFARLAKKNRKGFLITLGGFTAAGFLVPYLNTLAIAMLGDGDDDYYGNLPDWVRRNNLCIYVGNGKFITIPLPIELRAFYGLGEMAYQATIRGDYDNDQIVYQAINQITELLPINPLGNNGDLVATMMPDVLSPFWQIYENKDFTGKPIYRDNAFNKTMPEWTKAYNSTSDWLVNLSKWTNELAGGDDYKQADVLEPIMNWNPTKVEHLFESYFGGMAKTFNQTAKTLAGGVESVIEGEKSDRLQWYSTPVLNRFINDASDDRSSYSKVNQRYYQLFDLYEEVQKLSRGYSNEVLRGNLDYLEKLNALYRSDDYKKYLIFKSNKRAIDRIRNIEKRLPEESGGQRKKLQEETNKLKRQLLEMVDKLEK